MKDLATIRLTRQDDGTHSFVFNVGDLADLPKIIEMLAVAPARIQSVYRHDRQDNHPTLDLDSEPSFFVRYLGAGGGFEPLGLPPFFDPTHDLGGEDRPPQR